MGMKQPTIFRQALAFSALCIPLELHGVQPFTRVTFETWETRGSGNGVLKITELPLEAISEQNAPSIRQ